MRFLIAALITLGLSGCGLQDEGAGLTHVEFTWKHLEGGNYMPLKVEILDGKEFGAIDVKFIAADGTTFNFAADQVAAFEGQRIRADVHKTIVEKLTELGIAITPNITAAISDALAKEIPE
jgi:hypothetical protein